MQKIIDPFKCVGEEIYPGIIFRNDVVLMGRLFINLTFSAINEFLFYKISQRLTTLSFSDLRLVKSLIGLAPSANMDATAAAVSKYLSNTTLFLIKELTSKANTHQLLDYIVCNVERMPEFVLKPIQFINSHSLASNIIGSQNSVIRWIGREVTIEADFMVNKDDYYVIEKLPMIIKLYTEIFQVLGISNIINLNGLGDLFITSELMLDASVAVVDNNITVWTGNGFNPEDLSFFLLFKPRYSFTDMSFMRFKSYVITRKSYLEILNLPIEMLVDTSINFTSNERLINRYIESSLISQANKQVDHDGFKVKDLPLNTKSSRTNKLKGKIRLDQKVKQTDVGKDTELNENLNI